MLNLLLAFTALLLSACQCSAHEPPLSAEAKDYLDAHNRERAAMGVGPLRWSEALAKSASLTARLQRDKHNCSLADLDNSQFGSIQEIRGIEESPRTVVESWVAYGKNTCAAPVPDENRCGVYTQLVWRNTEELGCAQPLCPQQQSRLNICLYNPRAP